MSYPSPADLQSLSKENVAANFESIPFAPEDRLTPAAAKALFNELPTSCAEKVCSFIDSEAFYQRCCTSLSTLGVRKEEHGQSYKRLFFEVRVPDLLQEMMTLSRAIAENIFTVSLTSKVSCHKIIYELFSPKYHPNTPRSSSYQHVQPIFPLTMFALSCRT